MRKVYYLNFKVKPVEINVGYTKFKGEIKDITELVVSHKGEYLKLKSLDVYENKRDAQDRLNEYLAIKEFKNTHEHRCKYCGKYIYNKEELTVDHILPKCNGGKTVEDNLVISCLHCNKEKTNRNPIEYIRNINKQVKNQYRKQNYSRKGCKKISRSLDLKGDNVEYLAKKDSNVWDLNAFFNRKPCKSSEVISFSN